MKSKNLICFILVSVLLVTVFAGCGGSSNSGKATTDSTTTTDTSSTDTSTTDTTDTTDTGATDTANAGGDLDHYKWVHYFNYDWWGLKPWAEDEASKAWAEKFNIEIEFQKPDSNPDEKLNLMISSGDLPDSIMMDRGTNNIKMAQLGLLVDFEPLMANNSSFAENILESTRELLKIDGKLYGMPHWARKAASGGNFGWMYTKSLYEAAGSPTIKTFEDLYAYATSIKNNVPTNGEGIATIPFYTTESGDGTQPVRAFYQSMGGPTLAATTFYGRVGNDYQMIFRDDVYRAAAMEANKWYREGLLPETVFTDTPEMVVEKITNARVGLLYYDHSQDDGNNFRRIVRDTYPGDSIDLFVVDGKYAYPPANGLSPDKIYAEHYGTIGWNVMNITTKAENPQRIFDYFAYMLTKEGSIEMMYGPQGDLWDELDANGNPILKTSPDSLTAAENDRIGCWLWTIMNHADNVDLTKFAVNEALPEAERNWVVSQQTNLFTPLMMPLTDEYTGIADVIEPNSDLAIARTLCEDRMKATLPLIVMADSAEKANQLYDELIAFCDQNGIAGVEAAYNEKYQYNCSIQGGTIFTR